MTVSRYRALIISHFLIDPMINDSATSTALRNFLIDRVYEVVQLEFPFPESECKCVRYLVFRAGERVIDRRIYLPKRPTWLCYFFHFIFTAFVIVKHLKVFNLVIAFENLSFVACLVFKKAGIIKKLIYYSIDYLERRFDSGILNTFYYLFDKLACINSDENWVVSKEQIRLRKRIYNGLGRHSPFKIVPIAFKFQDSRIVSVDKIDFNKLVFVGTLRKDTGAELIVKAIPKLLKRRRKIRVFFIGGGGMLKKLRLLSKRLKVSGSVVFMGRIESNDEVLNILKDASLGLAPYVPLANSLSKTSDPGKVKLYLSCGIPVITTRTATSWVWVDRYKAGLVIEPTEEDLIGAIVSILKSRSEYIRYRDNALRLGKVFDVNRIFSIALRGYLYR